ncbi:MAG: MBL fold metallo-hydrolase [Pseudomonadota bacterium]
MCVLASGSKGNCTYVGDGQHGVLVDAGISARQILDRLAAAGLEDAPIDAVLLTHEHRDHVQGARVLADRLVRRASRPVDFWASGGTAAGIPVEARPAGLRSLPAARSLAFGALRVQPFSILHDTNDPVGFRIDVGPLSMAIATDLGRPTTVVEHFLSGLDLAILEFNHDEELLMEGRYPWWLKQRVRGSHGHLSNDQAAALVERIASPRLRHLVLGHLSQENNRPARARTAALAALQRSSAHREVQVTAAEQDRASPLFELEVP